MPYTYTVRARITLERLKRSKGILKSYLEQQSYVRILQNMRDVSREDQELGWGSIAKCYWRKEAAGHTDRVAEAGIYDGEEAMKVSRHCDPSKGIVYEVLRQKDERRQDEMGKPRVEFKGCGERTINGKMRFKYNVAQSLPPPSVGKSLEFDLYIVRDCHGTTLEYEIGDMDPTQDLVQLARWHTAIAYALANLPDPRVHIPMW